MKIIYYHHELWPGKTACTTFTTFNALGFLKNKINFKLVTVKNDSKPINDILKERFKLNENIDIHLINGGIFKKKHLIINAIAWFYLLKQDFDVLITRNPAFLPYALFLKKFKKFKVYYEAHDFFYDLTIRDDITIKKKQKQSRREKRYLHKIDGIITVSQGLKEIYEKYLPSQKILAAITGLTIKDTIVNKKRNDKFTFAYVGSMRLEKYPVDKLVKAFASTKNRHQMKLLLVGAKKDKEKKALADIIEKCNVAESVTVYGWLGQNEINNMMKSIDVGVAILNDSFLNRIASPLKVLEYLSFGCLIISSDLPGIRDIIEHNKHGYLVENEVEQWANAMDAMYTEKKRYKLFQTNCRELAHNLQWEQRAKIIHDFLKQNQ